MFKNFMEDVVVDVYEEFKRHYPQFCSCERCAADTVALALSHLHGKYAVSAEGEVFAKVAREDRQIRADVHVALLQAAEVVAQHPNH